MAANINNPELLRDDTVIYVNSKGIELAAAAAAQWYEIQHCNLLLYQTANQHYVDVTQRLDMRWCN